MIKSLSLFDRSSAESRCMLVWPVWCSRSNVQGLHKLYCDSIPLPRRSMY